MSLAKVEGVVVLSTRLRVSIIMVGRAGWNMILCVSISPKQTKKGIKDLGALSEFEVSLKSLFCLIRTPMTQTSKGSGFLDSEQKRIPLSCDY